MWMRTTLENIMLAVGPWSMEDPDVTIKEFKIDHIPTRIYIPHNRSSDGAIIYIHGGGFVLGTMDMYESVIREIVKRTKTVEVLLRIAKFYSRFFKMLFQIAFSMDYRLAPEHVFPAALDDCEQMVLHVLQHGCLEYGINKSRVVLMGDSAGGGLIASLTYRLRNRQDIMQPKV